MERPDTTMGIQGYDKIRIPPYFPIIHWCYTIVVNKNCRGTPHGESTTTRYSCRGSDWKIYWQRWHRNWIHTPFSVLRTPMLKTAHKNNTNDTTKLIHNLHIWYHKLNTRYKTTRIYPCTTKTQHQYVIGWIEIHHYIWVRRYGWIKLPYHNQDQFPCMDE